MKKIKIITLILLVSLCISCSNNTKEEVKMNTKEEVVKVMEQDENKLEEKDPFEVYKRYDNVDKSKLRYDLANNISDYYETANGFVGIGFLDEIPKVDDKRYGKILLSYTFASELIPISMKYDEGINYAKSVLPDDIKEERVKFDVSTGIFSIVYSSSKGNFVVCLNAKLISTENGKYNYDKEWISGISYLKEIV